MRAILVIKGKHIEIAYTKGTTSIAICIAHPHPLHGGSMHSKVVHAVHETCIARGHSTLRFNFRGVGKSSGDFDNGYGETEDMLDLMHWLEDEQKETPYAAGFSFGGLVAIKASYVRNSPTIAISPALYEDVRISKNSCIIQGNMDEIISCNNTFSKAKDSNTWFYLVPEADHFFHNQLDKLKECVDHTLKMIGLTRKI